MIVARSDSLVLQSSSSHLGNAESRRTKKVLERAWLRHNGLVCFVVMPQAHPSALQAFLEDMPILQTHP